MLLVAAPGTLAFTCASCVHPRVARCARQGMGTRPLPEVGPGRTQECRRRTKPIHRFPAAMEGEWAVVILAAGYGSRLQKDIEADPSKQFEHLLGQPKGLLPVGGIPLLDHWVRSFRECGRIGPITVVTNEFFYRLFAEWAVSRGLGRECVINDGTTSNDTRLGACRDLQLALEQRADVIGDRDVLVVAGDTLFFQDFSLARFLDALPEGSSGVVTYQIKEDSETRKRGIVEVDPVGRVTRLLEKPEPSETLSRSACPAFYGYRRAAWQRIDEFLAEKAGEGLAAVDAPGKLLAWLIERSPVHAVPVSGRLDIGNLNQVRGAVERTATLSLAVRSPHARPSMFPTVSRRDQLLQPDSGPRPAHAQDRRRRARSSLCPSGAHRQSQRRFLWQDTESSRQEFLRRGDHAPLRAGRIRRAPRVRQGQRVCLHGPASALHGGKWVLRRPASSACHGKALRRALRAGQSAAGEELHHELRQQHSAHGRPLGVVGHRHRSPARSVCILQPRRPAGAQWPPGPPRPPGL